MLGVSVPLLTSPIFTDPASVEKKIFRYRLARNLSPPPILYGGAND